jgi:hypothetical protein
MGGTRGVVLTDSSQPVPQFCEIKLATFRFVLESSGSLVVSLQIESKNVVYWYTDGTNKWKKLKTWYVHKFSGRGGGLMKNPVLKQLWQKENIFHLLPRRQTYFKTGNWQEFPCRNLKLHVIEKHLKDRIFIRTTYKTSKYYYCTNIVLKKYLEVTIFVSN